VRRQLERFGGREVDTAGDGFFAVFDGPARAVRCGQAICAAVRAVGVETRAGLHTGECELAGTQVRGIAVHIGARIAAAAGPGEVLVSSTVKDLVVGSGLRFNHRGERSLHGVAEPWRLFALENGAEGARSRLRLWSSMLCDDALKAQIRRNRHLESAGRSRRAPHCRRGRGRRRGRRRGTDRGPARPAGWSARRP
jgi:hypothetical protein